MGLEYNNGYCGICKETRKIERKTPNHVLHFLITTVLGIFTMGIGALIWIFIWIGVSIRFGGWRCSTCGSSSVKSSFTMPNIPTIIAIIIAIGVMFAMFQARFGDRSKSNAIQTKQEFQKKSQNSLNNTPNEYEVNQIRDELVEVARSNELNSIKNAYWVSNTFTLKAKKGVDNLYGFADYMCSNYVNSGRYDTVYSDKKIIHVKVKDSFGIATLDTADCFKE
ncbi:MAG: hypothetical protein QM497_04815 [Sulfurimonas sp.]